MFLLKLFASSVAVAVVAARGRGLCGTHLPESQITKVEAAFKLKLGSGSINMTTSVNAFAPKTIPVHFHIIHSDETWAGGNVTDTQVKDQIKVLNKAYSQTGFQFRLMDIDRTLNATWFAQAGNLDTPSLRMEYAMKKALRKGGPSDLNLYSTGLQGVNEGTLGYATFPAQYKDFPTQDGVVVLHSTLPGGTNAPFNLGGTMIHEVGHWFGLYHTFQGSQCSGDGDFVDDTPYQRIAGSGCPEGIDTCPDQPGLDPIHNYMDYTDDACYTEFTAGQVKRMGQQMAAYRNV